MFFTCAPFFFGLRPNSLGNCAVTYIFLANNRPPFAMEIVKRLQVFKKGRANPRNSRPQKILQVSDISKGGEKRQIVSGKV